jgi:hypothetical protein
METLSITIELENDAFQADLSGELKHIFATLAARISHLSPRDLTAGVTIRDSNGNTVGVCEIKDGE